MKSDAVATTTIVVFVLFAFWSNLCHVSGSSCVPYQPAPREDLRQLATVVNELAMSLHKRLSADSHQQNLIYSPLSIAIAFEMLFYGARGDTAEELRYVLGHKKAAMPDQLVHSTFHRFLCGIEIAKNSSSGDGLGHHATDAYPRRLQGLRSKDGLTIANTILVDEQHFLLPEYKNAVEHLYQVPVRNVDFARHSRQVLQQINEWAKGKTNGNIPELLGALDPSTVMILLMAVYFKESWKEPFDEVFWDSPPFYNYGSDLQAKQVPMMWKDKTFKYGYGDEYEALELPYKGDNFCMLVLLPRKRNELADFERRLTSEKLADIQDKMQYTRVIATLPKFKIKYARELSGDFKALGAIRTFGRYADFTGMTPSKGMAVSQVDHAATIDVNEMGSEATAVTAVRLMPKSSQVHHTPPTYFTVDRPFLLAVLDKNSGMILMMGRVIHL